MIESAERLFHCQGYAATGAREIANAAGVPQGSFTNHFRSKETPAVAALDRYFGRLAVVNAATLADRSRPPNERLSAYFDKIESRLAAAAWRQGCLIADLAVETAAHGELLRARLVEVLKEQTALFEVAIGELLPEGEAGDLAGFIVAAWHGTLLRMKAERVEEPLRRFRRSLDRILAFYDANAGRRWPGPPGGRAVTNPRPSGSR